MFLYKYYFLVLCYVTCVNITFASAWESTTASESDTEFHLTTTAEPPTENTFVIFSNINGSQNTTLQLERDELYAQQRSFFAWPNSNDLLGPVRNSHTFGQVGVNNCDDGDVSVEYSCLDRDLEAWEAPLELQQNYPYYQAGYDYEGRPLWVSEFGKYNVRKIIEEGQESIENLEKYIKQAASRILKSLRSNSTDGGVNEVFYLIDFDGLNLFQFANPKSITFLLKVLRNYRQIIIDHFGGAILINTNYVAQRLVNVMRTVMGRSLEKIDIYGTESGKWKPILRRNFPGDSLPTWYGGKAEFQPVVVYG